MKIFTRTVGLLVVMVLFSTNAVYANYHDARAVLAEVNANMLDLTNGQIRTEFQLSADDNARNEHMSMFMLMDMLLDIDIAENLYRIYQRQTVLVDSTQTESLEISTSSFIENNNMFMEFEGQWYSMPLGDVPTNDLITNATPEQWETFINWGMAISERFTQLIPVEFAAEQPDGYYAIETVINNDNIVGLLTDIIVEFINEETMDELVMTFGIEDAERQLEDLFRTAGVQNWSELQTLLLEQLANVTPFLRLFDFELILTTYVDSSTMTWTSYTFEGSFQEFFLLNVSAEFLGSMSLVEQTMQFPDLNPAELPTIDEFYDNAGMFGWGF